MSYKYREALLEAAGGDYAVLGLSLEEQRSYVDPVEFTRIRCGTDPYTGEPTQGALQSEEPKTDVNRIIQEYDRDGFFRHLNQRVGQFADVSEVPDYRTAIEHVRRGEAFFMELPAKVRAAFDNDVGNFLDALQDPAQRSRLEELELVPKEEAPSVPAPEGAPAPATPAPTQ